MDINSVRVTEIEGGEAKVAELADWRASRAFSELERVKRHFSEPQIVELTAAIALENFRSKFNPTLGIEAQGFCLLPRR